MRKVIVGICIASMLSFFFYKPEKTKAAQVNVWTGGINTQLFNDTTETYYINSQYIDIDTYMDYGPYQNEAGVENRITQINNQYGYWEQVIAGKISVPINITVLDLNAIATGYNVKVSLEEVTAQEEYTDNPSNIWSYKMNQTNYFTITKDGIGGGSMGSLGGYFAIRMTRKGRYFDVKNTGKIKLTLKFTVSINSGIVAGGAASNENDANITVVNIGTPVLTTNLYPFFYTGDKLFTIPYDPTRKDLSYLMDLSTQSAAQTTILNQIMLNEQVTHTDMTNGHQRIVDTINSNGLANRAEIISLKGELINQENANRIEMRTQGELTREEIKKDLQSQTISLSNKMDEIMNSYNNSGEQEEAGKIDSMVQQQKDAEAETAKANEAMQNVDYTAIQMEDGQELSVIKNVMQALLTQTNEKLKWGIAAAFTLVLAACAVGLRRFF